MTDRLSEQTILEKVYQPGNKTLATEPYGFDGQNSQRPVADAMATKVTTVSTTTYVGIAAPGSAQSAPVWQCMKVDSSSGTMVTFADGNANFDNIATDLTSLSYS